MTRSTVVWAERGVNSAKPLFSQTRITGSAHNAARLTDSTKMPPCTAPSPKNTTATWSRPREAARERAPECERHIAAHDAGRAEEAVLDVDEVHRAAETTAEAAVAPHQLRHDAPERRALRDRVPVRAVVAVDRVVV